jgi:hypothetical protein
MFPREKALKEKFYKIVSLSENEETSIMLTQCYYNKIKYRSVYNEKIEKKIEKIIKKF